MPFGTSGCKWQTLLAQACGLRKCIFPNFTASVWRKARPHWEASGTTPLAFLGAFLFHWAEGWSHCRGRLPTQAGAAVSAQRTFPKPPENFLKPQRWAHACPNPSPARRQSEWPPRRGSPAPVAGGQRDPERCVGRSPCPGTPVGPHPPACAPVSQGVCEGSGPVRRILRGSARRAVQVQEMPGVRPKLAPDPRSSRGCSHRRLLRRAQPRFPAGREEAGSGKGGC